MNLPQSVGRVAGAEAAGGTTRLVGPAVDLSASPGAIRTPAPELGPHTEEVLLELGYVWDEIASLRDGRVIL